MIEHQGVDFDGFRRHLSDELHVDLSASTPQDRLGDDLELDSLQRLEVLVVVEELGVHLPDDCVGPGQTLGGLHALYRQRIGTAGEPGPEVHG